MSERGYITGRDEDDEEPEPFKVPKPLKLPEDGGGDVPTAPDPDLSPGRTRDVDNPPDEPVSDLPG